MWGLEKVHVFYGGIMDVERFFMQGYVYILTNPSFREDWVKIGKSAREVDVRSKELDNTAVPLPFEIYATVQTSKYNELEAKLHKILTDLADLRIRKNREFFNIRPEEAFGYLKDLAELIDDAIMNAPSEDMLEGGHADGMPRKSTYKGKYSVTYEGPYYMKNGLVDAKMMVQNGKYVVLEGSRIDPNLYSSVESIRTMRNERRECFDETGDVIIKDVVLDSPSAAANFVRGGASNGKMYWRTEDDKPLNDFIVYSE